MPDRRPGSSGVTQALTVESKEQRYSELGHEQRNPRCFKAVIVEVVLRRLHLSPSKARMFTGDVVRAFGAFVDNLQIGVTARHRQRDVWPRGDGCSKLWQMRSPEVGSRGLIESIDQDQESP